MDRRHARLDGSKRWRPESAAANRYLFSRLGPQVELDVWTIRRSWLVLAASLATLLAGLALIYAPAARRPGVLLVAGVLLAAGALAEPETTILVAQASVLGLALALLAVWLASRVRHESLPSPPVMRGVVGHGTQLGAALGPAQFANVDRDRAPGARRTEAKS